MIKNLSQEFRIENSHVKWKATAELSDVIEHKYDIVDMQAVYKTVNEDFPELNLQIEKILDK